jgi:serine protease AprX
MKSIRPLLIAARFGLALGASLTVAFASLPGTAAAAPQATRDQEAQVDAEVHERVNANPSANVRVIITARPGDTAGEVRKRGGQVLGKLRLGNSTVADLPASKIAELAKQPGIVRIAYDAPVTIQSLDPLTDCCDRLQTVYPLAVGAVEQWNSDQRLTGTGIGVAVLDSGVHAAHPDFMNGSDTSTRVLQLLNGISNTSLSGDDDNGHGTFVSGIITGRGWGVPGVASAGSYIGIAPDANIISVKVSDSAGMAHISDVIGAIEWVAKHRQQYNIRVLNLSLVSSVASSYQTDMFDAAVELAWLQGLVVVVSAGNAGPNAPITSPANDPFIITAGATDDMGTPSTADDTVAWFSSYGQTVDGIAKPDLVAPGRNIVSTLSSPLAPLAQRFPQRVLGGGNYIRLSGTSAAAPVVTGVVAQLLQARPGLKPGQVKWLLTHTARPVSGPGTGAGYPQIGSAGGYSGSVGNSNTWLPNTYLRAAYASLMGVAFNSVAWDNVAWDNVAWDNVAWDNIAWDNVGWNNVGWNNVASDNVTWLPTN